MKQTLNKFVNQKKKIKKSIRKKYHNIEINEEEFKKNIKEKKLLRELFVIEKTKLKIMMIFF